MRRILRYWLGVFELSLDVQHALLIRSEFQAQRNDLQSQLNASALKISLLEDQVKEFHEVIETYRAVKNITDKTPEKIITRSFTQFRTMVEKAEHEPSTT